MTIAQHISHYFVVDLMPLQAPRPSFWTCEIISERRLTRSIYKPSKCRSLSFALQ
jgi:hypothetical protein